MNVKYSECKNYYAFFMQYDTINQSKVYFFEVIIVASNGQSGRRYIPYVFKAQEWQIGMKMHRRDEIELWMQRKIFG
jgi:hypothetical protein